MVLVVVLPFLIVVLAVVLAVAQTVVLIVVSVVVQTIVRTIVLVIFLVVILIIVVHENLLLSLISSIVCLSFEKLCVKRVFCRRKEYAFDKKRMPFYHGD